MGTYHTQSHWIQPTFDLYMGAGESERMDERDGVRVC